MVTIDWCKKQAHGIKFIEPNENLAQEYIQTAEETLQILKIIQNKSRIWLATTKYYCEYFSIYALLMRLGIKCEIHECTIEIAQVLEKIKVIPPGYSALLNEDKKLRIDNQYYLKNREVKIDYQNMLEFVLKMKDIVHKLTIEEIMRIRKELETL